MTWSDLPLRPSERTLRQFGGLWLVFFGGLATWQFFARENATAAAVYAALAVTVGPLGLVWPALVRPIFVAWIVLAFPIGWVVSTVLLAATYYGVFTPLALIFRLLGRDALRLRPQPGVDSYWTSKPEVADPRRFFQQF